jgi:hypothetical protein
MSRRATAKRPSSKLRRTTTADAVAIVRRNAAKLGRGESLTGEDFAVREVRLYLLKGCVRRDLPAPIMSALQDMTAALDDFTRRLPKATARTPQARRCLRETDAPELAACVALMNPNQPVDVVVSAVDACTAAYRDAVRKLSGTHGRR